jgi:hypothetical protein
MEQGSRTKLVAALVLALVFGSGLLVGYAVDGGSSAVAAAPEAASGEGARDPGRRRRVPVYESMNPSPEQKARMDSIMNAHQEKMNLLHAEYGVAQQAWTATFDALIQDTRDAITAVFPEERRAEYRRRLEEYDRRREAERAARDRQ